MLNYFPDIVVTEFPTKEIMKDAHDNMRMVLTFMQKPDCIVDLATSEAFQRGWLQGLGLEPDYRLALIIVPKNLDFEYTKQVYLENLKNIDIPIIKVGALNGIILEEEDV